MATLNVTNLQNTAATVTNVSLLADGTTTLVLNATGTSRLGGLRYNAGNLEVYTAGAVWVPIGGGGGGTVTGVTASLPLVSSGGAAPNLTINAATTSLPGSVQLADAAASQAGTSATLVNTPAFSVPKDASGMTGAALLPGGTTLQRPGTPSSGMLRFNTDPTSTIGNRAEVYDAGITSWRPLAYATPLPTAANFVATNGQILSGEINCNNFTISAGVTVTIQGSVSIRATGNAIVAGTVNGDGSGVYGPSGFSTEMYQGMTTSPLPGGNVGGGAGSVGGNKYSASVSLAGSSGSGGIGQWLVAGNAPCLTAAGGNSGASFLLRASTINLTGVINCNGQQGQSYYVFPCPVSGAGGGSGGTVILDADGACVNSGSISANGGAGSNGYGLGVLGGGGGGGGQIIVQSRFSTATLGTVSVAGGVAGTQAAGPYTASGGAGGGNGGLGGNGSSPGVTAPPLPGGTGIAQTFGSPLI